MDPETQKYIDPFNHIKNLDDFITAITNLHSHMRNKNLNKKNLCLI